jgi:hypothetical protein
MDELQQLLHSLHLHFAACFFVIALYYKASLVFSFCVNMNKKDIMTDTNNSFHITLSMHGIVCIEISLT